MSSISEILGWINDMASRCQQGGAVADGKVPCYTSLVEVPVKLMARIFHATFGHHACPLASIGFDDAKNRRTLIRWAQSAGYNLMIPNPEKWSSGKETAAELCLWRWLHTSYRRSLPIATAPVPHQRPTPALNQNPLTQQQLQLVDDNRAAAVVRMSVDAQRTSSKRPRDVEEEAEESHQKDSHSPCEETSQSQLALVEISALSPTSSLQGNSGMESDVQSHSVMEEETALLWECKSLQDTKASNRLCSGLAERPSPKTKVQQILERIDTVSLKFAEVQQLEAALSMELETTIPVADDETHKVAMKLYHAKRAALHHLLNVKRRLEEACVERDMDKLISAINDIP